MMASFPKELLLKLLSLLPIDSILKFKSVSKEWHRMLETPYFCRLHYEKQQQLNKTETGSPGLISLRYDKLYVGNILGDTNFKFQEIINVPSNNTKIKEIQSCNGVLCLHLGYRKVVIWNPLSDKYQELRSPVPQPRSKFVFGFGYDRVLDDYKLIALEISNDDGMIPSAMVYSVKSDRWKDISGFNYRLRNQDDGILVADSVHWLTKNKSIIAFNLITDQFQEIPLPSFCRSRLLSDIICRNIGVFSGRLSITCVDYSSLETLHVMEISEANVNWMTVELDFVNYQGNTWNMKPIANLENGKVLMREGVGSLLLYDPKTKTVKQYFGVGEAHSYEATLGFYGGKLHDVGKGGGKAKRVAKALTRTRKKTAKF